MMKDTSNGELNVRKRFVERGDQMFDLNEVIAGLRAATDL
jgi:hypothetical protein